MMNTLQRATINILKSAITGQTYPLPEDFDLDACLEMVRMHHMPTLIYEGAVRCGVDKNSPAMQQLLRSYFAALIKSEKQVQAVTELFRVFEENGIDYMPLKGSKMKFLYPKPELRMMGDADILIRTEQYERIKPLLPGLGYQQRNESDHELVWLSGSLYLELHKRLIPSYNEDFYDYYGSGWHLAHPEKGNRYTMSPEDEWIYLFTHFAKHFRDGGIGCRHVVDLWVYLRHHPEMDEVYIRQELEKLYLLEFYGYIRMLLDVWFGDQETDDRTNFMTDYIFASGSWGQIDNRTLSIIVRDSKSIKGTEGKFRYLMRTAFPPVNALNTKYTILRKAPWMLPAVWVYRPFYKLLCERGDVIKQKNRMDLLSTEGMSEHKRILNYMGLDYHF